MIINATNNTVLVSKTVVVSRLALGIGLMWRRKLQDEGWVFTLPYDTRADITNLFVFQTIGVIWLNKHKQVLQKKRVRPFTPHVNGIKKTKYFIELPPNELDKVRIGDNIAW